MLPFLAAGPSQRIPLPPCPDAIQLLSTHTNANLGRMGVCCGREGSLRLWSAGLDPLLWAGGREGRERTPRTLLASSHQAPARYCLKPHSSPLLEQVQGPEKL